MPLDTIRFMVKRRCMLTTSAPDWVSVTHRQFGLERDISVSCGAQNLQMPVEVLYAWDETKHTNTLVSHFKIFLRWLFKLKTCSIKAFNTHPDKLINVFIYFYFVVVFVHCFLVCIIRYDNRKNQLCCPINDVFAHYSREAWCLVRGWFSRWDSRAAGSALPSHWYWNICHKVTQEHCRVVSNIFKCFPYTSHKQISMDKLFI